MSYAHSFTRSCTRSSNHNHDFKKRDAISINGEVLSLADLLDQLNSYGRENGIWPVKFSRKSLCRYEITWYL
nr:hypothetical protein BAR15_10020 [Bartonella sp. AR 15-3]